MIAERRSSPSRVRAVTAALLILSVTFVGAQTASAQDSILSSKGFHTDRNYFSPEPFEHFDTVSGNLVLVFTDLALPGNGGRLLEFQRVYNNARSGPHEISRWSFGFPGMVMRIIEKDPPPTNFQFDNDIHRITLTTPRFVMADGSERRTAYLTTPDASVPASMERVRSAQFYDYNRTTRTMWMPDGTVCQYEDAGFDGAGRRILMLRSFSDPFGNTVTLTPGPGTLLITQSLGNEPAREIALTLDADDLVTAMSFEGRTWVYSYAPSGAGTRDITEVTPPLGPGWTFEYDGDLTGIVVPTGGRIQYEYESRWIYHSQFPEDPEYREEFRALRYRDIFDGDAHLGRWSITTGPAYVDLPSSTGHIITPSDTVVSFESGPTGLPGRVLDGGIGVTTRTVYQALGGPVLERDVRTFDILASVNYGGGTWWGTSALVTRQITREDPGTGGSRTYTTEFTYANTMLRGYHRPTRILETGELVRETRLTYVHLLQPVFLVGLPASEQVTVNGESFHRSWTYDSATGFRTSDTTYGITTSFTPDAFGNMAVVTKANGKSTSYAYSRGQISVITGQEPNDQVVRVINSDGTLASETRGGRTTSYTYDALSRVRVVAPPGASSPTLIEYDELVPRLVTTHRGQSRLTTRLDAFGRVVETIDGVGVRRQTGYDAEGRVIFQSYPFNLDMGMGTTVTYDALDRVVRETNPDGSFRQRTYGLGVVAASDEEGRTTVQTLQAFGHPADARLAMLVDAGQQPWLYTYNALGSLTAVIAPDGLTRSWQYDTRNLLVTETHPESGTVTYAYDAAGVPAGKTDANGTIFQYGHDGNDRLTAVVAGGRTTTIAYEPGSDHRQSVSNDTVATTFGYDSAGRLERRQDAIDGRLFTTRFEYDADDRMTAITYPSGRRVAYAHDPEGRVFGVSEPSAGRDYASYISHFPSGGIAAYTGGNLIHTQRSIDPLRYWIRSITSGPLQLTYTSYSLSGNVGTIEDARPNASQTFTYDALDRLETAGGSYGSVGYAYDVHGNRQSTATSTYQYEPGTLRLIAQNGIPFTYDGNGNLVTAGGASYTYTPGNMLETAGVAGGTVTYAYDGDDQRIRKTVGGETTYYLRGRRGELLTEWSASGVTRDYVYADTQLLAVVTREPAQPVVEDFESGASLAALGFSRITNVSNQAGEGLGGSAWGVRGDPGASAGEKYYGQATWPVVSTGRAFQFEGDFDHADAGYGGGFSAFEMRWEPYDFPQWFLALTHGGGDTPSDHDRLALYLYEESCCQIWQSGPGLIVPGTRQRLTVTGMLSTITDYEVNPDGSVQIFVDGVLVADLTGLRVGTNVGGPSAIEHGEATWNRLMVGPMGRFDNLSVAGGAGAETVRFYHTDAIDSVRMITDEAGQVVERYDYLPFGEQAPPTATLVDPRQFAGTERDPETAFDYVGARYYQSQTGRFTRPDDPGFADPFDPQSMNLYAYARNNPLKFIDPDGHQFQMTICGNCEEEEERERRAREAWLMAHQFFLESMRNFDRQLTAAANFSAGVGDALTGRMIPGVNTSLTEYVRNRMGTDSVVAKSSLTYRVGDLAGGTVGWTLAGSASATAAAIANGKRGALFGRGTQTVFNSSKVRFGWGWDASKGAGRDVIRLGIGPARGTNWWSHIPFWYP